VNVFVRCYQLSRVVLAIKWAVVVAIESRSTHVQAVRDRRLVDCRLVQLPGDDAANIRRGVYIGGHSVEGCVSATAAD